MCDGMQSGNADEKLESDPGVKRQDFLKLAKAVLEIITALQQDEHPAQDAGIALMHRHDLLMGAEGKLYGLLKELEVSP